MSERASGDWFEPGLPFQCTGCGDCCTGEPGAVWLDDADVLRLATHLGLGVAEFEQKHVRLVGGQRSLYEHFNGDCEFFDGETRGCRVYDGRPTQCRNYPWWPHLIASKEAWQGVCEACEGARVTEPLVSADSIRERAAELRRTRGG